MLGALGYISSAFVAMGLASQLVSAGLTVGPLEIGIMGGDREISAAGSPAGFEERERPGIGIRETDLARITFLERYCFEEVNRQRLSNGLRGLALMDSLVKVARAYSRRMAEEGFFSHWDPNGLTLDNRLAEAKIKGRKRGENLSRISGYIDPVPEVVAGWMKSESHRTNILDPEFNQSAIGAWIGEDGVILFTEIFMTN